MLKSKKTIKEVIVVEGKTDTNRLKALFNVDTIETNGSALNKKTLSYIKQVSQTRGVILLLDPDQTGEIIRKKIASNIETYKQAFIMQKNWKKKIGVNEASNEAIIEAIKKSATYSKKQSNSITLEEYNVLQLNTKMKRTNVCNTFNISYCNNKQLLKRLNLLGITAKQLTDIIKK